MISDEAISALIDAEGTAVRIQVGDGTPTVAGWLDREEMREFGPARVFAAFMREVAEECDRVADEGPWTG